MTLEPSKAKVGGLLEERLLRLVDVATLLLSGQIWTLQDRTLRKGMTIAHLGDTEADVHP